MALNKNGNDLPIDLETLYEEAPCGYLSFTGNGEIVKINRTLLAWTGHEGLNQPLNMHFSELITRGGKLYYEMFYFPLLQLQSRVNEISFDFVRKDGTRFPALVNSSVLRDEDGNIVIINATVHDISDRKRYETELLEAKKSADRERSRFEFLSDFTPEMIWTADASGKVSYTNKRFSGFFSLDSSADPSAEIVSRIHPEDRVSILRKWKISVDSSIPFQVECRIEDTTGQYKWFVVHAVAIEGSADLGTSWIGACNDIDRHVLAVQDLDGFISIAGHELKTPITSLKASVQLLDRLIESGKTEPVPMLVSQIGRGVEKMNTLVDDLLNAGSIREGQMELKQSDFNIRRLLDDACSHIISAGQYTIEIDCQADLNCYADAHRIEQVVTNFLNNAVKYAPKSLSVFISANRTIDGVRISVTDRGEGIEADKLPHLFERYFRVNKGAGRYSGLGLGLYICSEIVKRHQGEIGVESTVGKGSTFWFTLPAHL
jgi:PAS domain S-box-containing protein